MGEAACPKKARLYYEVDATRNAPGRFVSRDDENTIMSQVLKTPPILIRNRAGEREEKYVYTCIHIYLYLPSRERGHDNEKG